MCYQGAQAIFTCSSSSGSVTVSFWINGVIVEDPVPVNITIHTFPSGATLTFSYISTSYSGINIRCMDIDSNEESNNALLLVQGLLDKADNLAVRFSDTSYIFYWDAPFTLDVPATDPDITYCVRIVVYESIDTLQYTCDINITQYSFQQEFDPCIAYTVVVTSFNQVGEGGSSHPLNLPSMLMRYRNKD